MKDPPSPTCAIAPLPGSPPSPGPHLCLVSPRPLPAPASCPSSGHLWPEAHAFARQEWSICLCVSALCTDAACVLGVSRPHPRRAVHLSVSVLGAVLLCSGGCQTVRVLVIKMLENTAKLQTSNHAFCIYNNVYHVSASTMVLVWTFVKKVGLLMNFRFG